MRLLKIHIHDFRSLKNVVMTFEPDIKPQVFPIGGENGSGKSTLLQLIFILLHCSIVPERHNYLNNMIKHAKRPYEKWELRRYDIANIELLYQEQKIKIGFFLEPFLEKSDKLSGYKKAEQIFKSLLNKREELEIEKDRVGDFHEPVGKIKSLEDELKQLEANAISYIEKFKIIPLNIIRLSTKEQDYDYGIFCEFFDNDYKSNREFLTFASNHVFLVGQSTQVYTFLNDRDILELFKEKSRYETSLEEARKNLPNFYNYNNFALLEILKAFKTAKEKDWQKVLETGEYGNIYNSLVKELNDLLGGKKYIIPTQELDNIRIRYETYLNQYIELSPEDLSHGELKRLNLYSWIKKRGIRDSLVLIDEIENGLHPDWQYEIVRELASWGENQYLLATHSFYLCEALTPRHVKELEPILTNPIAERNEHVAAT